VHQDLSTVTQVTVPERVKSLDGKSRSAKRLLIEHFGDDRPAELASTVESDRDVDHLPRLDADQRREIGAALREHGHSLRAIAGAVGVSEGAVRKDITAEEVRTGTHLAPAEVAGQDGKRYPARRPTIVAAKDERQAEKAQRALASSGETPEGLRTVRDIGRQSRAEERADVSRIEDATPSPTTARSHRLLSRRVRARRAGGLDHHRPALPARVPAPSTQT